MAAALAGSLSAATFTVSQDGRGAFNTIQSAVDKAQPYDEVVILDFAVYNEQVTLRAPLHHFSLRSSNPSASRKPVLLWSDKENVGPKTCQEALNPAKITFDHNGALRLIEVRDIRIEGIAIDGAGAMPFVNPNVWGNGTDCNGARYPLFHGNTGLLVYASSQVVVVGCEFTNAYFGTYIKDNNPQGPFARRGTGFATPAFARIASGNHLFEGNAIHDNTWGVFMESAWGLGSTFRDNLIYENHHATPAAAAGVKAMVDGANQPGGAFFFKDVQSSSMTLQNNTFRHNFLNLAGGYLPGAQHLIVNNVIADPNVAWSMDPNFSNHFMALDQKFPKRLKCNAYAGQAAFPALDSITATAELFDTVTQQQVRADTLVHFYRSVRILNGFPAPLPESTSTLINLPLSTGMKQIRVPLPDAVFMGAVLKGGLAPFDFSSADQNRWVETKFRSLQPSEPDFLSPRPEFHEFLDSVWSPLRYPPVSGAGAILGAIPPSARPQSILRIVPLSPVLVEAGQMVLRFSLQSLNGGSTTSAAAPVIAYLRLERKLPADPNAFGGGYALELPEAEAIPAPAAPIRYGYNELKLPLSGLSPDSNGFGFVELAVTGMGTLSNVAAFPIIPLTSLFTVEALDETQDIPATVFAKDKTFRLRVAYAKTPPVAYPVQVALATGAALKFMNPVNGDSTGSISSPLPFTAQVQFTESPDDGVDLIWAAAYLDSRRTVTGFGQSRPLAFDGTTALRTQGKHRPALKAADILKRRNVLGRKTGLKGR